jgi:hypothetical protein
MAGRQPGHALVNGEIARTATRQALREALGKIGNASGLDLRAGFVYRMEWPRPSRPGTARSTLPPWRTALSRFRKGT